MNSTVVTAMAAALGSSGGCRCFHCHDLDHAAHRRRFAHDAEWRAARGASLCTRSSSRRLRASTVDAAAHSLERPEQLVALYRDS